MVNEALADADSSGGKERKGEKRRERGKKEEKGREKQKHVLRARRYVGPVSFCHRSQ